MSGADHQIKISATLQSLDALEASVANVLQGITVLPEPEVTKYNVWLALHELCTNIVRHAYAGEPGWIYISFLVSLCPDRTAGAQHHQLRITVQDQATNAFDMESWAPPNLDEPQTSGMGLWLINQLMDEIVYEPAAGHNRWILTKYLISEPAAA